MVSVKTANRFRKGPPGTALKLLTVLTMPDYFKSQIYCQHLSYATCATKFAIFIVTVDKSINGTHGMLLSHRWQSKD